MKVNIKRKNKKVQKATFSKTKKWKNTKAEKLYATTLCWKNLPHKLSIRKTKKWDCKKVKKVINIRTKNLKI